MDLILGPFADACADKLEGAELERLEALLSNEDADLLKWAMGQESPAAAADRELLARIVAFRATFPPQI